MNRLFILVMSLSIISTITLHAEKADTMSKKITYPAANHATDTYTLTPEWKLVWADEFEGDTLNPANWNYQVEPAGRFNEEWQRYTNSVENAYVEDGNLVIKAIHESDKHGLDQYTSARLNTANKQAWKHGRVAARIQMPYGEGMWPAFWLLGNNIDENGGDTPWPATGEIDVMEFYGSKDDGAIEVNMHYEGGDGKHAQMGARKYQLKQGMFAENYHVFEMEWNDSEMIWYVDGQEITRKDISKPVYSEFHQPFFILLNIAVGGKHSGRPDNTTQFPQYMYVDWVRVYQK